MSFESHFALIERLSKYSPCADTSAPLSDQLKDKALKAGEEYGEMAANVVAFADSKNASRSASTRLEDIQEEAVDLYLNALDVYFSAGGDIDNLLYLSEKKCKKWAAKYGEEL